MQSLLKLLPSKHAEPTEPSYTSKCAQKRLRGEVNAAAVMRLLTLVSDLFLNEVYGEVCGEVSGGVVPGKLFGRVVR